MRPAPLGDVAERHALDPRLLEDLGRVGDLPGDRHLQGLFGLLQADLRFERAGPVDDQLDPIGQAVELLEQRRAAAAVFRRQVRSSWTTTRITSDISNAAKSDDWSPLLVSITTVPNAALSSPKSRRKRLGIDLGGVFDRLGVGQDVQARSVARSSIA